MSDNKFMKFVTKIFEGDIKKARDYAINDVLKPRFQQMVWEMTSGVLRNLIWRNGAMEGNVPGSNVQMWKGANSQSNQNWRPMASEWTPNSVQQGRKDPSTHIFSMNDYQSVGHPSHEAASVVLLRLREILERGLNTQGGVPYVTVSQMLALCKDKNGNPLKAEVQTQRFGWANLDNVETIEVKDPLSGQSKGWRIVWPPCSPIEDLV